MPVKLVEELSKLIHRMGREREDRIINGKTNLTVAIIFLIDDNWINATGNEKGGMSQWV